MTSAAPPTEFFPGIDFNASFYNLGQSAVTLDYLNSNFLRSTGYAISRAQFTLFNGSVDIKQNLDVSGNINASAYLLNGVPFSPSQWTTSVNDIYYNTGNVGIGKTNPSSAYKLDVSGNINADKIFRAGTELTQYTDTNVRTVLSNSAGSNVTWNTGTNKFDVSVVFPPPYTDTNVRTVLSNSAGSNVTWNTGTNKFDVAAPYTLPTAGTGSGGTLGGVKVDGSTITINSTTGVITATAATPYTLPTAGTGSGGTLGGVKVDGTTISINATTGIISRTGNTILLNNTSAGEYYGWTSQSSGLFRVGTNGQYSTGSLVEDVVLRSTGHVLLQSGIGDYALRVNATNNNINLRNALSVGATTVAAGFNLDVTGNVTMRNAVCIGSTSILSNYTLDVSGNIITTGNIALANASRSVFWTGTNSNLARAGVAGEYSTSAAINDIVLRSGNKLILQSGTGAAGLVIDTANNVGIGISAPIASLDIVKTHNSGTTLDLLNMRFDNNWGLKFQQSYTGAGNIQYNLIHRYNAVDYNSITFKGANVGIGTTNPNANLHLHGNGASQNVRISFTDNTSGVATTDGFCIGKDTAQVGYIYNTENNAISIGTNNTERMRILADGNINIDRLLQIGGINNYNGGDIIKLRVYASDTTGTAAIFKHPNDTQGLGIRYNEIYQTNSTNDAFNITSVGNGGLRFNTSGTGQIFFYTNGTTERMRVYTDGSIRTPIGGAFIGNALFARAGGFDIRSICDSGGMYIEMGNEGTFTAHYLRMGAYGGYTYIESNQNRTIRLVCWSGVLTGTLRQWEFNVDAQSRNPLNSANWTVISDQRIKENIVKADLKTCYDNVKNINLYRFNYIDSFQTASEDKNKLGYIAQEIHKHFPKATIRSKTRLTDKREIPDLLSIDLEQINLTLYGAVKQLIKIVEKQNKRIKTLESLLNIEDNNDVEDDAGEAYERIYDDEEVNIDDIEPSEPSNEV